MLVRCASHGFRLVGKNRTGLASWPLERVVKALAGEFVLGVAFPFAGICRGKVSILRFVGAGFASIFLCIQRFAYAARGKPDFALLVTLIMSNGAFPFAGVCRGKRRNFRFVGAWAASFFLFIERFTFAARGNFALDLSRVPLSVVNVRSPVGRDIIPNVTLSFVPVALLCVSVVRYGDAIGTL